MGFMGVVEGGFVCLLGRPCGKGIDFSSFLDERVVFGILIFSLSGGRIH